MCKIQKCPTDHFFTKIIFLTMKWKIIFSLFVAHVIDLAKTHLAAEFHRSGWHLQFRCNKPVSHFCKTRNGQITFHRKIFWTICLHQIIAMTNYISVPNGKFMTPIILRVQWAVSFHLFHFAKYSKPIGLLYFAKRNMIFKVVGI